MSMGKHPITPLAAVIGGVLAGAVGTVCLDTVHYLKYRRRGGKDSPLTWEFAPVDNWDNAPAPGLVAKRVIEGFSKRELPDSSAWLLSTVAHLPYGSAWGRSTASWPDPSDALVPSMGCRAVPPC